LAELTEGSLVLAVVFAVGLIGKNDLVAAASGLMLVLQVAALPDMFRFLQTYANELGITFLLIGLLLPYATGQMGLSSVRLLLSTHGLVAVAIGAVGAWLAAEGISLLTTRPEIMVGIVVGSVLGVAFLGGIPAGPLVASGLAAVIFRFLR
jgi:uncharacterized membrane protein (DUF441 family)